MIIKLNIQSQLKQNVMPARLEKKKIFGGLKLSQTRASSLGCRGVTRSDFKFYKNKFFL